MEPQLQIERVNVLTDSQILTLTSKGYTISDVKTDPEDGTTSINVYNVGKIVKRIIFLKDERKNKN